MRNPSIKYRSEFSPDEGSIQVLTLDSGVPHDFDGDGDEELAIEVTTHQRAKD